MFMCSKAFIALIVLVLAFGTALRLPSVPWLIDIKPETGMSSFHPDEERFVRTAEDFQGKQLNNYVLGMSTHVYMVKILSERLFDKTPELIVVLRLVSVVYGVLTLALLVMVVRSLTSSSELAILTSGLSGLLHHFIS